MSYVITLLCFVSTSCRFQFRFRSALYFGNHGLASSIILHTAYSTKSMMFTTSPLTPTSPASSSYDSHSPSFDVRRNLNGYDQTSALIAQQRGGYSFSHPPSVSRRAADTKQLSWWRAGVRNVLMKSLVHESRILGAMQVRRTHSLNGKVPTILFRQEKCRTPLLDKYFLYTSSLGTHMFFMTVLPCLFFFGHTDAARG